jgi:hypothetical protein
VLKRRSPAHKRLLEENHAPLYRNRNWKYSRGDLYCPRVGRSQEGLRPMTDYERGYREFGD